jgi:hypothetical protein
MFRVAVLAAAVLASGVCAQASASIGIAFGPFSRTSLRVDAAGNAEVAWTARGVHDSVVIPPAGRLFHGTLRGSDVSRPTTAAVLPYRLALRRTPDGRIWALQAWQTGWKGPVELRFSRWRGKPTSITVERRSKGISSVLTGRATFQGRGVSGKYRTNGGALISLAAQFDCFGCPAAHGAGWFRFNGVKTQRDGTFGSGLKAAWSAAKYRVSIVGPNLGATLAPDAAAIIRTRRDRPPKGGFSSTRGIGQESF